MVIYLFVLALFELIDSNISSAQLRCNVRLSRGECQAASSAGETISVDRFTARVILSNLAIKKI